MGSFMTQLKKYPLKYKHLTVLLILLIPLLNSNTLNFSNNLSKSNSTTITSSYSTTGTKIFSNSLLHQSRFSASGNKLNRMKSQNIRTNSNTVENVENIQSLSTYTQLSCSTYCININGNSQFNQTGKWLGNGTKSNPYILTNYDFAPNGFGATAIAIANTNAYFVVNGNRLAYASSNFINFNNVTNGIVENNSISETNNPFFITGNSSNILIANNTITGISTFKNGI